MGLNIFTKSFNFSKIAKFKCEYMIELFGVKLDQPATVATNIALFIICTYCAISVMRSPAGRYDFVKKYSLFLLFTGIAALLGGIFSHGFKYYFGLSYSFPGWLIALGGAYYASIAAFRHALANKLWQDIKANNYQDDRANINAVIGRFYGTNLLLHEFPGCYDLHCCMYLCDRIIFGNEDLQKNTESWEHDLYVGHRNWSSCVICVYL
jgi:hypothetical protein